jgi:anthranilate phosphoribosyltransferase
MNQDEPYARLFIIKRDKFMFLQERHSLYLKVVPPRKKLGVRGQMKKFYIIVQ